MSRPRNTTSMWAMLAYSHEKALYICWLLNTMGWNQVGINWCWVLVLHQRQAFRDVDLGGRVVSRATRHPPPPIPILGKLQNYPCFLEARVPRVVNWGGWDLPCPGPVQFYLDSRYPMTAESSPASQQALSGQCRAWFTNSFWNYPHFLIVEIVFYNDRKKKVLYSM